MFKKAYSLDIKPEIKYILDNNRESFDTLVNFIKENNIKREDTINKKYDYIQLRFFNV